MKKAVNLRDSENPLPHEHEATSFLFKRSSWAQTDHITLAAPMDSVAFQKKSISWGRYSDPVATQKSAAVSRVVKISRIWTGVVCWLFQARQ
jgi:hypothetical protein